jgi:hypothetical protein
MEEAAVGVWAVCGLGLCVSVMAWDVGLGHLVSFDGERAVVWSALAAGMHRRRMWPALALLGDLVVRTAWQVGIGEPPFLPAVALVGTLVVRGLLAQVDLWDEPPTGAIRIPEVDSLA